MILRYASCYSEIGSWRSVLLHLCLCCIQEMWGDWIHAHILYHSKCLEVMTRAHMLVTSIDEDEEMEVCCCGGASVVATH